MREAEGSSNKAPGLAELRSGGKPALAGALALIEAAPGSDAAVRLLEAAYLAPLGLVIGLTGPPGVGKSTLINELMRRWRASGQRIGVIAVDPSSQRTGGALLGDRIRMRSDPLDDGVFVRSLAARGRLGGLAELAYPAAILMRALFDRVIVESVGVGQSEAEIANVADRVVLCVQPGSGDSLQFMKAGIMEIPDIAVVTKADVGLAAGRALADLKGALSLAAGADIPALRVSATSGEGVDALTAALAPDPAGQDLARRRHAQAEGWLASTLRHRFGEEGLTAARSSLRLAPGRAPFSAAQAIAADMRVTFAPQSRPPEHGAVTTE
jgi:LAO/AO transport system kinase